VTPFLSFISEVKLWYGVIYILSMNYLQDQDINITLLFLTENSKKSPDNLIKKIDL
jgi:hypothetical protein